MEQEGDVWWIKRNETVRGRLEAPESADEERDGSRVNGIQGHERRRWWEEIKGRYDWRRTSSGEKRKEVN